MSSKKAIHAYFAGVVQGVGFRFTARHLAQRYSLGGWVRNCSDGRVELIAFGDELKVEAFIKALNSAFEGHISEQIVEACEAPSDCENFEIRF